MLLHTTATTTTSRQGRARRVDSMDGNRETGEHQRSSSLSTTTNEEEDEDHDDDTSVVSREMIDDSHSSTSSPFSHPFKIARAFLFVMVVFTAHDVYNSVVSNWILVLSYVFLYGVWWTLLDEKRIKPVALWLLGKMTECGIISKNRWTNFYNGILRTCFDNTEDRKIMGTTTTLTSIGSVLITLYIAVAYAIPYISMLYGSSSHLSQIEIDPTIRNTHLMKWLTIPIAVSAVFISRRWILIFVYSIHTLFLFALPFITHQISATDVHIVLNFVIPVKIAVSVVYIAISQQQDKLNSELQHATDMIMVSSEALLIHKEGKVLDVNPSFQKLFGYTVEECQKLSLNEIFIDTPLNCLNGHNYVAKLARNYSSDQLPEKSQTPQTNKIPRKIIFECIGKSKSGKQIALEVISRAHRYLGEDVYVLGIRSIHSRQEKDNVLESVDDLRAKSRFLSIVSHELKTPLNAIQLLAEMISDECSASQEVRDNATIIQKSAQHLLIVIKDILDYSKLEVGTLTLSPETFDIAQAIEDVIDVVAQNAYEKGLELAVYIPKSIHRKLYGDSNRFQQVLSNLVSNAIKFTDLGHVLVNVDLKEETEEEVVISVSVIDSGIGIAHADQKKLFRMFSQVDNSTKRKYDGTGLGLAICKQLVTLMDGKIGVKSSVGNGSEFWFYLRLKKLPADLQNSSDSEESEEIYQQTSIYGPGSPDVEQRSNFNFSGFNAEVETASPNSRTIYERRRSRNAVFVDVNGDESKGMIILKTGDSSSVIPISKSESTSSCSSPVSRVTSETVYSQSHDDITSLPPLTPKEGYTLLLFSNPEVTATLQKYMKDFSAKHVSAARIEDVLDDIPTYLEEPVQTVIVDDSCLLSENSEELVRELRKEITLMNKKHLFKPATPLMVLVFFSKSSIEEEILQQFKIFIRKPVYLSPIEKLFYNDLVVHKKYPVFESEFDDSEPESPEIPEPTTESLYGETSPVPLRKSSVTKLDVSQKERIFVNFEVRPVRRRFSSFIRRSSFPIEKFALNAEDGRRKSMVPELLSLNEISRFKSPRNTRLSLFAKLMLHSSKDAQTVDQCINKVLDKVQRLRLRPRILMVEDQLINLKITKRIIESLGVDVEVAENGQEALGLLEIPSEVIDINRGALERTKLFEFDLILTDGNMPVMDGLSMTRSIRNFEDCLFERVTDNKYLYKIPIIGLTAASEDFYQHNCINSGMDEVLTKPVRRTELERMLMSYLQENEEWKELQIQRQRHASEMKGVVSGAVMPDVYHQFDGFKFGSQGNFTEQ